MVRKKRSTYHNKFAGAATSNGDSTGAATSSGLVAIPPAASGGEGAASTLGTSRCTPAGDLPNSRAGVGGGSEGAAATRGTWGGRGGRRTTQASSELMTEWAGRSHGSTAASYTFEIAGGGDGDGRRTKQRGAGA